MKETREFFIKLREKFPEVKAISFFGSRIRRQEREKDKELYHHGETLGGYTQMLLASDLDITLFYDNDVLSVSEKADKQRTARIGEEGSIFSCYLKDVKKLPNQMHVN